MSILTVFTTENRVTVLDNSVIVNAPAVVGPRGPRGPAGNTAVTGLGNTFVLAGDGLSGGGNLASNVSIAVNSTVVRTSGNQSIGGTKNFSNGVLFIDAANSKVGINTTSPKIDLQIGDVGLGTYKMNTSTTLPNQIIDSWSALDFRSAKYQVQIYSTSANEYEISEIFLVHNDIDIFVTEYAVVNQGTRLMNFNASLFNNTVRLIGTPTYAINEVKVFRTVLSA
jgi:hypothetical protein